MSNRGGKWALPSKGIRLVRTRAIRWRWSGVCGLRRWMPREEPARPAASKKQPARPSDQPARGLRFLEDKPQRVLHLTPAVGWGLRGGPAEESVPDSRVRVGPHQRVRQVVRLEPELELIVFPDRERLGDVSIRIPKNRPCQA